MRYEKFLIWIHIPEAPVCDPIVASRLMVELPTWPDFIAIFVRTCRKESHLIGEGFAYRAYKEGIEKNS